MFAKPAHLERLIAPRVVGCFMMWALGLGAVGFCEENPEPPETAEPDPAERGSEKGDAGKGDATLPKTEGEEDPKGKEDAAGAFPPSETVELPEEDQVAPPVAPVVSGGTVEEEKAVEWDESVIRFSSQAAQVRRGDHAVFILEGPRSFLDQASVAYVLRDDLDRDVAQGLRKVVELKTEVEDSYRLDVPTDRALRMKHILSLTLSDEAGRKTERLVSLDLLTPGLWDRWLTLIHAPCEGRTWSDLGLLGIHGGMAYHLHLERFASLKMAHVPFFVENVAPRLFSRYHVEQGLWDGVISEAMKAPDAHERLIRTPSFASLSFASDLSSALELHAKAYRGEQPLFYSLAAEPSVTRLSASFDFDFHPDSIKAFRRWLEREVYGTIPALNKAWQTAFEDWDQVWPMTTNEARARLKDKLFNFAPWMDFRDFQDHLWAKTFKDAGRVMRKFDPGAQVGVTGAMGPSAFGGWDWSRLTESLDVVEAYDIGEARALWRDLSGGKPALAMAPLDPHPSLERSARQAIWNLALDGGVRGVLLWDERVDRASGMRERVLLNKEGQPAAGMEPLVSVLKQLKGPLGLLLAHARRAPPEIALLYSPSSIRAQWLFEADQLHGDQWLETWGRDTSAERRESPQLRLRVSWAKLLSDLGFAWRFISSAELEKGVLGKDAARFKALVLPRTVALSDREMDAIKAFVQGGGGLLIDALCGVFDEHGQARKERPFDEWLGVDASGEPFLAQPEHPLEAIQWTGPHAQTDEVSPLSEQALASLASAYSDIPRWMGAKPERRHTFRESPVLVRREVEKGSAVYLNLNLEDYCRWRLRPAPSRARATRDALEWIAFSGWRGEGLLNRDRSELPWGTELVWLELGEGASPLRVLALRRNVQAREHEFMEEGVEPSVLDQAETYKLVFNRKMWISNVLAESPMQQTDVWEGVLDPVTPTLLAVSDQDPGDLVFQHPEAVRAGEVLSLSMTNGTQKKAAVYGVEVYGPEGEVKLHYGGSYYTSGEDLTVAIPFAFNDVLGEWAVEVWDLVRAKRVRVKVQLQAPTTSANQE